MYPSKVLIVIMILIAFGLSVFVFGFVLSSFAYFSLRFSSVISFWGPSASKFRPRRFQISKMLGPFEPEKSLNTKDNYNFQIFFRSSETSEIISRRINSRNSVSGKIGAVRTWSVIGWDQDFQL